MINALEYADVRRKWALSLQMFAEGGEGAGESAKPSSPAQNNSGDIKNVVYGKQPEDTLPDAGEEKEAEENSEEDEGTQEDSFESLITGKHKKEFNSAVQRIINRRFAAEKQKQEPVNNILNKLYARYGVDNIDALTKALDDPTEIESRAYSKGMTSEQMLDVENIRAQNMMYRQAEEQRKAETAAREQYNKWLGEVPEVKAVYPDFDLESELANPQFAALISTKNPQYAISMLQAYRTVHFDELEAMAQKAAAAKVADSVRARGARPAENGVGSSGGAIVKNDVHKLTKADRMEIARRAARGEVIKF